MKFSRVRAAILAPLLLLLSVVSRANVLLVKSSRRRRRRRKSRSLLGVVKEGGAEVPGGRVRGRVNDMGELTGIALEAEAALKEVLAGDVLCALGVVELLLRGLGVVVGDAGGGHRDLHARLELVGEVAAGALLAEACVIEEGAHLGAEAHLLGRPPVLPPELLGGHALHLAR